MNHSWLGLPPFTYELVNPVALKNSKLIDVSSLASEFDFSQDLLSMFMDEKEKRLTTRYAGHQFGVWAGQLGDGRAHIWGEYLLRNGDRLELQTKGSGHTPFSRMGDGKAVVRSCVREYLASEAMHGLKIPTSRCLALFTGDAPVFRETVEKEAMVIRAQESQLRFGHFEYYYHFDKKEILKDLIEYTKNEFFKGMSTLEMLREVMIRTAKLMSQWQSVGFCHGVMNTDNMSFLGLTIDYGPFGFLEDTNLRHICNHSDHQGRYAYLSQPRIALWNLERLFVCFLDEVKKEDLIHLLESYQVEYKNFFEKISNEKLGLSEGGYELMGDLLSKLDFHKIDYTYFFRLLSSYDGVDSLEPLWSYYGKLEPVREWLKRYDQHLEGSSTERHLKMKKVNPKYILRNYMAQEAIDDLSLVKKMKELLYHPFDEHPEWESYALPTPPSKKDLIVSCSS